MAGVFLEPLGLQHAEELAWQYRDGQIAAMTGLPVLRDAAEAACWIAVHSIEHPASYAAMHPGLGLIGYGELRIIGDAGYLCLWVGVDHQGRGFGGQIVRLLCGRAVEEGLGVVLTSAFDDNTRSLRALRRAGFREMRTRMEPPHDDRTFLCAPGCEGGERGAEAALRLFMAGGEKEMPVRYHHHHPQESPEHETTD